MASATVAVESRSARRRRSRLGLLAACLSLVAVALAHRTAAEDPGWDEPAVDGAARPGAAVERAEIALLAGVDRAVAAE